MRHPLLQLLTACLLLIPLAGQAENSTHERGYTVHHNAIPSAMLTPDVAKQYGIVRSKYRGLLNVSVIRERPGTVGESVPARVEVTMTDLTGRSQPLPMRRIREGDAYYYIGEFPVVDGETYGFRMRVTPQGEQQPIEAGIEQQFFVD